MSREEEIKGQLIEKFGLSEETVRITRPRRIWCELAQSELVNNLKIIVKDLGFSYLCAITGLDGVQNLVVLYHLGQDSGIVLTVKVVVDKNNPVIKTITEIFSSAEVYERELVDLFGFIVEGLLPGHRYPLTDDWPQGEHPLRKDWRMNARGIA